MVKFKINYINLILIFIVLFSIFGLYSSSKLTYAKYNNSISEICGDRMENSCNTVQNSEYSKISLIQNNDYSIPISLLGVIFYFIVLFLSLLGIYLNKKKSLGKKYQYSLIVITTLGIIFSIIFTLVQAILIRAFCTLCIISAINTLIIFILSLGFIILYNKNKY